MKLSIAMVFVCLISLITFAAFPYKYIDANTSMQAVGCRNFQPGTVTSCDDLVCGGKTIRVTDPSNWSSSDKYSVVWRTTTCKFINAQTGQCYDDTVNYFERVEDSSCCDLDNDGYNANNAYCVGNDCNDNNANINPGATEVCDGVDNNCNGQTDEGFDQDGDGYKTCNGDCNDNNSAIIAVSFRMSRHL